VLYSKFSNPSQLAAAFLIVQMFSECQANQVLQQIVFASKKKNHKRVIGINYLVVDPVEPTVLQFPPLFGHASVLRPRDNNNKSN